MADITLVANTNYSALTVANGDRILLAGFTLNVDVNPTQTGVTVQAIDASNTTGNTGKVTLGSPTSYTLSGWILKAGTGPLLAIIPSGTTVGGAWVGGSVINASAVSNNNGTITGSITGGSANGGYGVAYNNGTITGSITGGSVSGASGVVNNNGTITGSITGGSVSGAYGVSTNNGTITGSITGGSVSGAYGVSYNNGSILTLSGVLSDAAGRAIYQVGNGSSPAPSMLVRGSNLQCIVPTGFATIYYIGAISPLATINGSPTMIQLSEGGTRVYISG